MSQEVRTIYNKNIVFEDMTFKAGSPDLLERNLVQKFGQEDMNVINQAQFRIGFENEHREQMRRDRNDPRYVVFKNFQDGANEAERLIKTELERQYNEQKEASNGKNPFVPTNAPLLTSYRWRTDKYAYIRIVASVALWNKRRFWRNISSWKSGAWRRAWYQISTLWNNATKKQNVQNLATKLMSTPSTADLYGLTALNNYINRKFDDAEKAREWRKSLEAQKQQDRQESRDRKRRRNDPFRRDLNSTEVGNKGSSSREENRPNSGNPQGVPADNFICKVTGTNDATIRLNLSNKCGKHDILNVTNWNKDKSDLKLEIFPKGENSAYKSFDSAKRNIDTEIDAKGNKPYFFLVKFKMNGTNNSDSDTIEARIYADKASANKIRNYVNDIRTEGTVITFDELKKIVFESDEPIFYSIQMIKMNADGRRVGPTQTRHYRARPGFDRDDIINFYSNKYDENFSYDKNSDGSIVFNQTTDDGFVSYILRFDD